MPVLKVYSTRGSPPSAAVMATCTALGLSVEKIEVNYMAGEHLSPEHEMRNPQRELPVLEDDGFFLSESVAIMQYLCEKYGGTTGEKLYPRDPKQRAIVNHRLLFNLSTFYSGVGEHTFGAVFGLEGDAETLRSKCVKVLSVMETILQRQGTRFVAGDNLTLGDIAVSGAVICLDAANFDLKPYPTIATWYETFKGEKIWEAMQPCRDDLKHFFNNRPSEQDLAKLQAMKAKKL